VSARKLIPVACTLEGDDLRERAAAWTTLIAAHGIGRREVDGGFELRFAPDASDELARLVAGEQSCCAWASWSVAEDGDVAVLTATSPDPNGVSTLRAWFS
jgi:hypothetical protein